jgi:hypothetical protein
MDALWSERTDPATGIPWAACQTMTDPFLLVCCGQLPLPLLPSLQTSKRPNSAHVTWPNPGLDTEGSGFFLVHVYILQWTLVVSKLGKVMSTTKFAQCDRGAKIWCGIICCMTVSQLCKLRSLPRMGNANDMSCLNRLMCKGTQLYLFVTYKCVSTTCVQ